MVVESAPIAQELSPTSSKPNSTQKGSSNSVVACRQCHSRKVKCDSQRPQCKNCVRRSDPCEYDAAQKRRGPDKRPGTRQRSFKKRPEGLDPLARRRRVGRQKLETTLAQANILSVDKALEQLQEGDLSVYESTGTAIFTTNSAQADWSSNNTPSGVGSLDTGTIIHDTGFSLLDTLAQTTEHEVQGALYCTPSLQKPLDLFQSFSTPDPVFSMANLIYHPRRVTSVNNGGTVVQVLNAYDYVPRGPSLIFSKQTWWDNLLTLYSHDTTQATQKVFQDLSYILISSTYWLSHIHFGRFIRDLYDPERRLQIQPSLVFATLAVATLMKSSEAGLGKEGRKFALWLRDAAQASLDASVNASWIDPSLAKAALILTIFESSAHPLFSPARASSAVYFLDSLIQAMNLVTLDAHDPMVPRFPADELPIVSEDPITLFNQDVSPTGVVPACPWHGLEGCPTSCLDSSVLLENLSQSVQSQSDEAQVFDELRQLEATSYGTNPLRDNVWPTFQWPDDELEVQREEIRRLCWSSMLLVHILKEYTPHLAGMNWDLYLSKQEIFAIHFPSAYKNGVREKINSAWPLNCRIALLWNACHKLRQRPDWEVHRTELLGKAWMAATSIEVEFAKCARRKSRLVLNAGREFIFQLKLLISTQFTRHIPLPHTLHFDRDSAKEWLAHRQGLVTHVRNALSFVTKFGAPFASLIFAKRPLTIWYAMYQMKAGTMVWKADPSMASALEQSLEFLALVDSMTVLWQSEPQRIYYEGIRNELIQCCITAGITVPAPVPIPGLPSHPDATVIPSPFFFKEPSSSDILMVPLD
ncbi:hypothetical protein CPB86DRAFT_786652 [Serendipita vermifera]|nr:hypothetical protein CPB86DRAFT_786652 [Serendipita vermifera]